MKITIATEFTLTPGPRYIDEGKYSGELFRQQILADAVRNAIASREELLVDIDGTAGYGTSFLEESFGGLIRVENISYEDINQFVKVKSDESRKYLREIESYLVKAHEKKFGVFNG